MKVSSYRVVDLYSGKPVSVLTLDEGVREVVCRLIDFGATPYASCDGHGKPKKWYVAFSAPLPVAEQITKLGYLGLTLTQRRNGRSFEPAWFLYTAHGYRQVRGWLRAAAVKRKRGKGESNLPFSEPEPARASLAFSNVVRAMRS